MELANLQIQLGGHSHIENPLRSKAWQPKSPKQQQLIECTQDIRTDGCMHDFRDLSGEVSLMSFRTRTSDPDAATSWYCLCGHNQGHKVLEGRDNVAHSAKYTNVFCAVIAKHIMKRQTNLVNAFWDTVYSYQARTKVFLADPVCFPCGDQGDDEPTSCTHTAFPSQSTVYNPPEDEEEDTTIKT